MKIQNTLFISQANLKGAKKEKSVLVLMVISVIAVVVLVGYLNLVNNIMSKHEERAYLRQVTIAPGIVYPETYYNGVNEDNVDEILSLDHVVSGEPQQYADENLITIQKITDEKGEDVSNSSNEFDLDELTKGLHKYCVDENLIMTTINGKELKDSPTMTCIVPDKAMLQYDPHNEKYYRIETSHLLGKTLTLNCNYNTFITQKRGEGNYVGEWTDLANLTFDLKVVGVYHHTSETAVNVGSDLLISPNTALELEKMALDIAKQRGADVDDYINDPYSRTFILNIDTNENAEDVANYLIDNKFIASVRGCTNPLVVMMSEIYTGSATFLIIAIMLLTIINLFLSVHSNLNERKGQIGLMKALGYKTSQIFFSMYMENVISAFKALIIGGVISALAVFGINAFTTSDGDPYLMSYVLPWSDFAILLVIALAVILSIPLICQLIMINMIAKIQPQEAMSA